jgi:hypothetical protein
MTEENIKRMAKESGFSDGEVDYCQSIIIHLATLIAQQEREACAKIADEWAVGYPHPSAVIAETIRGQA